MRSRMLKSEYDSLEELGYYSQSAISKKRNRSLATIISLVVIWYCGAVVTITTTKMIMNSTKLPFLLCTVQFVFAYLLSKLYNNSFPDGIVGGQHTISSPVGSLILQISVSYTFGFVLTNSAFSIVSAAFAETVKASEPISTVAIGFVFLKESVSYRTYATLLPICLGVATSCFHNDSFNLFGLILAALSNLCFSSRAVIAKKLNTQYPEAVDDISMFSTISLQGLIFLVPITMLVEGNDIIATFISERSILGSAAESRALIIQLIINGSMFALYNLVSYLVLRRTDLITHSVLNAFRRVFIIIFTTYFFRTSLSAFNMLGIFIAIIGVILFGYSRSMDHKQPRAES